jgi:hypothetical protein
MHIEKELNENISNYDDYEEFPYCLQQDIESDIKYLYSNTDISKESAEELLQHCEYNLITLIEDMPINEYWIECIRLEILAYRLFKIDKCNKNMAEHIIQCKILEICDDKRVERETFEQTLLLISKVIPNLDDIIYYGEWCSFLQDCLQMVKYRHYLEDGDFVKAYKIFKNIMLNLIVNEEKYLKIFDLIGKNEIEICTINEHNGWIKSKFEIFLSVAAAANKLEDIKEFFEGLFKQNKIKCLSEADIQKILIRINVEKFYSDDIKKYNIDDINGFINYFEKLNLLEESNSRETRIELLILYMRVVEKVVMQTNYEKEINYEKLFERLILICDTITNILDKNKNRYNSVDSPSLRTYIQECYDIKIVSKLLLCLYKPELLVGVMEQLESYNGNHYIMKRIIEPITLVCSEKCTSSEDKERLNEIILGFIKLYRDINYIEQLLTVKEYSGKEFAYYTTLQTFSYLLSDENLDGVDKGVVGEIFKYRLSIMNVGYMNDPNEGRVFYDVLSEYQKTSSDILNLLLGNADKKIRKQYKNVLVFLKSFSDKIDKLTMWSEYGDKGKGCCIVVDGETFRACKVKLTLLNIQLGNKRNINDDYQLYNVAYWDSINNKFIVDGKENVEVKKMLDTIVSDITKVSEQFEFIKKCFGQDNQFTLSVIGMIHDMLSSLSYLFKYEEYKDENEVRLVFQRDMKVANRRDIVKVENEKDKLRSMLYIRYPMKTLIKEVILGPKVEDCDKYAPYIIMKLSDINIKCDYDTRLTNSSIDYR